MYKKWIEKFGNINIRFFLYDKACHVVIQNSNTKACARFVKDHYSGHGKEILDFLTYNTYSPPYKGRLSYEGFNLNAISYPRELTE